MPASLSVLIPMNINGKIIKNATLYRVLMTFIGNNHIGLYFTEHYKLFKSRSKTQKKNKRTRQDLSTFDSGLKIRIERTSDIANVRFANVNKGLTSIFVFFRNNVNKGLMNGRNLNGAHLSCFIIRLLSCGSFLEIVIPCG